ncbi:hypothetical protein OURE66S_02766 [Oligella ureolytica]
MRENQDISDHRLEQRGVLHAQVCVENKIVHCFVVHLGLFKQDQRQADAISSRINRMLKPIHGLQQVKLAGNIKFDVTVSEPLLLQAAHLKGPLQRPVVVIASTRDGEEAMFIEAISQSGAAPLYVLVPRHPERFEEVKALLDKSG